VGIGIFIFLFRGSLSSFFTSDPEILEVAKETLPFMALAFAPDCFQCALGGIIKGMGLQDKAAKGSLFTNLLISLPLSYFFGIHLQYGV
jgi:Na+-driven multidrug efflux pump